MNLHSTREGVSPGISKDDDVEANHSASASGITALLVELLLNCEAVFNW